MGKSIRSDVPEGICNYRGRLVPRTPPPAPRSLPMPQRKRVFFVSDRTGITVEALGSSLLTQFAEMDFNRVTLPFIDSIDKARAVVDQINEALRESHQRPLVLLKNKVWGL